MKKIDLDHFKEFIGREIVEKIEKNRKENNEVQRDRTLTTSTMIWLCVMTALHSGFNSLEEILALASTHVNHRWEISTAAFCKARMRFSPQVFIPDLGRPCFKTTPIGSCR